MERGDSVAILVFNKTTQKVILIGQFRYPAYEYGQGWLIETIAGMVDPGESPEESARREIQEEIGLKIDAHVIVLMRQPGTRTPFNIQGCQMLEYDPENSKSLAQSKQKLEIL